MSGLYGNWMRLNQTVRLAILLVVLVGEIFFIRRMISSIQEREDRRAAYIVEHRCVREGFAGRHAEPVYRCDTGLWLERELGQD